jgi:hypothetical protein
VAAGTITQSRLNQAVDEVVSTKHASLC